MKYIIIPIFRLFILPFVIIMAFLVTLVKSLWNFDFKEITELTKENFNFLDFKEYLFNPNYFKD